MTAENRVEPRDIAEAAILYAQPCPQADTHAALWEENGTSITGGLSSAALAIAFGFIGYLVGVQPPRRALVLERAFDIAKIFAGAVRLYGATWPRTLSEIDSESPR
jgi:hypothetical protein